MMLSKRHLKTSKGNIFALLFAAVGLTGVLGVVGMQTISGPVRTMTKVNQKNITENDIITNGRIAILNATVRPDFDTDDTYEPAPFIVPADCTGSATIGGCLPTDIGAVRTDSWGTPYRYCVWDHGDDRAGSGTTPFLLQGRTDEDGFVIAVVSAGANKTFETECEPYNDTGSEVGGLVQSGTTTQVSIGASMRVEGTDDIAKAWSYAEAKANSGGLWSESGATGATIERDLTIGTTPATQVTVDRTTGLSRFPSVNTDVIAPYAATANSSVTIDSAQIELDDENAITSCSTAAHAGTLRWNTAGRVEVCDGSVFINVSVAGGEPWRVRDADGDTSITMATTSTGDEDTITMTTPGGTFIISNSGVVTASGNVVLGDALTDTVQIDGNTTNDGTLTVLGNVTLGDALTDTVQIDGNTTNDGTLTVLGAVTLGDALTDTVQIDGNTTNDGTLTVLGNVTLGDALTDTVQIDGTATVDGNLIVDGNTTLGDATGDLTTVFEDLTVGRDANITRNLDVTGTATVDGSVKLGDNVADLIDITTGMLKIAGAGTCGGGDAGKLQYTGGVLQYCNGTAWQSAAAPNALTDIGNVKNGIEIAGNNDFVLFWDNDNTQWDVIAASGLATGAADNSFQLIDGDTNDNDTWIRVTDDPTSFNDNDTIRMATSNSERLKITSTGEVVIGFVTPDTVPTTDASAILKIDSEARGVLIPRMDNTAVGNISSPAKGLLVYNTTDNTFQYNAGTSGTPDWRSFATDAGGLIDAGAGDTLVDVDTAGDGSANTTVFTNNSAETMRITSGGDVGIGTASPSNKLHVAGDIRTDNSLILGLTAGDAPLYVTPSISGSDISANVIDWAQIVDAMELDATTTIDMDTNTSDLNFDSNTFVIDSSANAIGIGNAAPDASAIVEIDSDAKGFLPPRMTTAERDLINAGTFATGLTIYNETTNTLQYYDGSAWQNASAAGALTINDLSDAKTDYTTDFNMFIGSGAGAGILVGGQYNLAIGQNAGDAITTGDNNIVIGYDIDTSSATASNELNIGNTIYGNLSTDFVGIGIPSPSATLDVAGDVQVSNFVKFTGVAGDAPTYDAPPTNITANSLNWDDLSNTMELDATTTIDMDTNTADLNFDSGTLYIDNAGFVGVGNASPDVALDVTGDIEYTGALTDVSDRRLKTDIHELSNADMIDRLSKIKTYEFKMKNDPKGRIEFGVMAQELEVLFPELVHTASDDMGTKSVNYIGLIAPMIEVSKSLKAENDMLKADMASLKSDTDIIKAQIDTLNKSAIANTRGASLSPYLLLLFGFMFGALVMVAPRLWRQSS